jgi:hypothetical protein
MLRQRSDYAILEWIRAKGILIKEDDSIVLSSFHGFFQAFPRDRFLSYGFDAADLTSHLLFPNSPRTPSHIIETSSAFGSMIVLSCEQVAMTSANNRDR